MSLNRANNGMQTITRLSDDGKANQLIDNFQIYPARNSCAAGRTGDLHGAISAAPEGAISEHITVITGELTTPQDQKSQLGAGGYPRVRQQYLDSTLPWLQAVQNTATDAGAINEMMTNTLACNGL